jgi:dimethylaniline monooxygenase (N-oxide forming)
MKVCIIGGGSSGVTTGKALLERGVPFDILEKGSNLGGMWRYQNDSGTSSAYRSLHIDTSRKSLAYSDFPISPDLPDYLSHAQVLAYLTAYAEDFKVLPQIQFGTTVISVSPAADGWEVTLASGEKRNYRAVVVANGHLSVPRRAEFPGHFDGEQLHSHHYRTAAPFEGKRVLVVGIGNSGVDIAVDVCRQAQGVVLSTRRGAWLMPKYIFGIPKPEHPIWREHACVSQDLLSCIGHGWISVKRNVKELRGASVLFEDGAELPFEAIIHATGYKTVFPFLEPAVFEVRDNDVALYKRIVPPDRPGLFFAGLVQPIGPTVPLVEVQGRWIAAVCAGAVKLPPKQVMLSEIAEHQGKLRQRYVDSPRYTLEVDFREHARQLRADL